MTIIEEMMNVKDKPQASSKKEADGCSAQEVNAKEAMPLDDRLK